MEMESIPLKALEITYGSYDFAPISFQKAELVIVTDYGDKLWYIEIDGVAESELLRSFSLREDIEVVVTAVLASGSSLRGKGYFHANEPHQAAAIRGDGELIRL
ncbi:hypothetical protein [Paenibacillus sp. HB172176]|uniref:hypothetical protein n=1 Tax=Paenibacillus sp. HB172176 TaxID=2493690 RepID=UPI001F107221|nr:hypothetical protein [Paenibacillus sp. HB172176]